MTLYEINIQGKGYNGRPPTTWVYKATDGNVSCDISERGSIKVYYGDKPINLPMAVLKHILTNAGFFSQVVADERVQAYAATKEERAAALVEITAKKKAETYGLPEREAYMLAVAELKDKGELPKSYRIA